MPELQKISPEDLKELISQRSNVLVIFADGIKEPETIRSSVIPFRLGIEPGVILGEYAITNHLFDGREDYVIRLNWEKICVLGFMVNMFDLQEEMEVYFGEEYCF